MGAENVTAVASQPRHNVCCETPTPTPTAVVLVWYSSNAAYAVTVTCAVDSPTGALAGGSCPSQAFVRAAQRCCCCVRAVVQLRRLHTQASSNY